MASLAHDSGPACLSSNACATQKDTFDMRKTAHQFRVESEMHKAGGGYLDFARQMPLYDEAVIVYKLSTTPDGLGIHPNLFHLKTRGSGRPLSNKDWKLEIRKTRVNGEHKIVALKRDKRVIEIDGKQGEKMGGVDVTSALITAEGRFG